MASKERDAVTASALTDFFSVVEGLPPAVAAAKAEKHVRTYKGKMMLMWESLEEDFGPSIAEYKQRVLQVFPEDPGALDLESGGGGFRCVQPGLLRSAHSLLPVPSPPPSLTPAQSPPTPPLFAARRAQARLPGPLVC